MSPIGIHTPSLKIISVRYGLKIKVKNKRKDLSEIKSRREKSGNEELKAHRKSVNAEE